MTHFHILVQGKTHYDVIAWFIFYALALVIAFLPKYWVTYRSPNWWVFSVVSLGFMFITQIRGAFPFESPLHWFS